MKSTLAAAVLASTLAITPALAEGPDAATAMTDLWANAIDTNHDSRLSRDEILAGGQAVFQSMDADGSGDLTVGEIIGWEHGLRDIAEFRGQLQPYETAVSFLYRLVDRNADGTVSESEHTKLMQSSMTYADADGDGQLTSTEYNERFFVNAIIRQSLQG